MTLLLSQALSKTRRFSLQACHRLLPGLQGVSSPVLPEMKDPSGQPSSGSHLLLCFHSSHLDSPDETFPGLTAALTH